MSKIIASNRCSVVRECAREDCILKMLFRGYTNSPSNEKEKSINRELERANGIGFQPFWRVIGNSVISDLTCESFKEKR